MPRFTCAFLALPLLLTACASQPENPSFPVNFTQANQAVSEMRTHPRPLRRPLVIVGGFLDPNVSPPLYRLWFEGVTSDSRIITVSIGLCGSFDECRQKVIDAIESACPSADPNWTVEVDVVGASQGGLVARCAAAPATDPGHPRRLRIARLFTISSPHSGARMAQVISLTDYHRDMRPDSPFLQSLARSDTQASYELYPYVRLHDEIVGERYAAPPGVTPLWLPNPPFTPSHAGAMCDPRILADIARRLRDEKPLSRMPAAPLPNPA